MSEEDISNVLECVFHEVFDDTAIAIHREMTAKEVGEWDSFNHVRLIVAVEDRFEISFSTTEVADLQNVGELIDLISSHRSKRRSAG